MKTVTSHMENFPSRITSTPAQGQASRYSMTTTTALQIARASAPAMLALVVAKNAGKAPLMTWIVGESGSPCAQ